jgi:hypothetical protein
VHVTLDVGLQPAQPAHGGRQSRHLSAPPPS